MAEDVVSAKGWNVLKNNGCIEDFGDGQATGAVGEAKETPQKRACHSYSRQKNWTGKDLFVLQEIISILSPEALFYKKRL